MFVALPEEIKAAAKATYRQFIRNLDEPSLHRHELKRTHRGQHREGSVSVYGDLRYRAIYVVDGDTNVWYWIGSHSDYNRFTGRK